MYLVIGKNSNAYDIYKRILPAHFAISHLEFKKEYREKFSSVIIFSFPRNEDQSYIDFIQLLVKLKFHICFISTAGLNGLPYKIINSYFYLRFKRAIEILVLKNNGHVIRIGKISKNHSDCKIENFSYCCLPDDLKNIEWESKSRISYAGKIYVTKSRFSLLFKLNIFLTSFFLFNSVLFKLNHILFKLFYKNSGYTLASNFVALSNNSIGLGLASVAWLKNPKNINQTFSIPPIISSNDYFSKKFFDSRSYKLNGFGSRWHGVRPLKEKFLTDFPGFSFFLNIPLFPPGKFTLFISRIFKHKIYLQVQFIEPHINYVLLNGNDEASEYNSILVSSATLNCGIFESHKILSKSLNKNINAKFAYQKTYRIKPVLFLLDIKRYRGLLNHKVNSFYINNKINPYIIIPRPSYPLNLQNQIIFGSFFNRLFLLLKNLNFQTLNWIFYTRFGYGFFNKQTCQIDIQACESVDLKFLNSDATLKLNTRKFNLKLAINDLNKLKIISSKSQIEYNKNPIDSLHVHVIKTDLKKYLIPTTFLSNGAVYIGSVSNLFDIYTPMHTSHLLLKSKISKVNFEK